MSGGSMLKDLGYYGFAKIVLLVCSFISLPIITKELGTTQYGVWSQLLTTVTLLGPVASLGMPQAFMRFFSHNEDKESLAKGFYTLLVPTVGLAVGIAFVIALVSEPLAEIVLDNRSYSSYFIFVGLLIVLFAINSISVMYFRATDHIKAYSLLTIVQSVAILVSVIVLLSRGNGIWGVIMANIIGQGILAAISLILITMRIGICAPDFSTLGGYIRFGLPLMPYSLVGWITDLSDRYLVGIILGMSAVGIYSAAYSTAALMDNYIFILQVTLLPTLTRFYERGETEKVKSYLKRSYRYYILLAVPSMIGLSVLAEPLLLILTTEQFLPGTIVVSVVALACLMKGLGTLTSNLAFLEKRTGFMLKVQASGALVNLGLNIILIPVVGLIGAAIATLISFVTLFVLYRIGTREFIHIPMDVTFMMKTLVASAVMAVVVYLMSPIGLLELIVAAALGAGIYFALMLVMRGVTRDEIGGVLRRGSH